MTTITTRSGYAPVNGLNLYYEIHGAGHPLVLLHGAFSAIDTSFGRILPGLAQGRQVIGVELQAHGRTADIDRPLDLGHLAADIVALLDHLGIDQADLFGYSTGAAVALQVALRHPTRVRKLVFMSATFNTAGVHPGLLDGLAGLQPEHMHGTPWHAEYMRLAPQPENFPTLVAKVVQLNNNTPDIPAEAIQSLQSPTLIIIGDSDLTRPEHAVEMFRLLGGGVFGDTPAGLPKSQLAILPGVSHVTIVDRADLLLAIIPPFLDKSA